MACRTQSRNYILTRATNGKGDFLISNIEDLPREGDYCRGSIDSVLRQETFIPSSIDTTLDIFITKKTKFTIFTLLSFDKAIKSSLTKNEFRYRIITALA
jgi:hypothetical protein